MKDPVIINSNEELKKAIKELNLETRDDMDNYTNQQLYDKYVHYTNYGSASIMNGHTLEGEKQLEQAEKILEEIDKRCCSDFAKKNH